MTNDVQGLDLARGLATLKRNALLALLLVALGGGAGYALASQRPVVHTATAKVLLGSTDARDYQDALDGTVLSGKLLKSYAGLIDTQRVVEAVQIGTGTTLTTAQLKARLSARAETSTLLLDVFATDQDPATARALADAAAAALITRLKALDSDASKIVTADVVDPAVTAAASRSRTLIAGTGTGAVLGLVLVVLIGLVRAGRDNSIRGPEDAELALGAPLLGTIPSRSRRHREPMVVTEPASAPAEAFRELRTALMLSDDPPTTILVTSAVEGDGKTVVAINLAAAFALAGQRVVLVDADLRRGRIATSLGLDATTGLTTLATAGLPAGPALQRWNDLVDVLPSGPPVGNPSELLGSTGVTELLAELRELADVVIIDAPPVIPVTDAVVLSAFVDAVLVVTRHGVTQRGLAAETRRRLTRVGGDVRGVVLNDVSASAVKSYYAGYPADAQLAAARPGTD